MRSNSTSVVLKVPSVLVSLISALIVYFLWTPSASPDLFGVSFLRLFTILFFVAVGALSLLAIKTQFLRNLINQSVFTVVAGMIFLEGTLRLFSNELPVEIARLLPAHAKDTIAHDRGLLLTSDLVGEGLLYTRIPNAKLTGEISALDDYGFRNSKSPSQSPDVVLIGASVINGTGVSSNIGEKLKTVGLDSYTMATAGWSAGQFRDAYRKYIRQENRTPKTVVTLLTFPRALYMATNYSHTRKTGGGWREFMGQPRLIWEPQNKTWMPWTLSILNRLPYIIVSKLQRPPTELPKNNQPSVTSTTERIKPGSDKIFAEFEWGNIRLKSSELEIDDLVASWEDLLPLLSDLTRSIVDSGAKPLFLVMPKPVIMALPYVPNFDFKNSSLLAHYSQTLSQLRLAVENDGGIIIDIAPIISQKMRTNKIFGNIRNAHLTEFGDDVFAEITLNSIQNILIQTER